MESTGLHLKMSPPLSETTFETESTGVQLDYVGEGKVLMNPEFIDDRFDVAVFDRFGLRPQSLVRIATLPVMKREHDSGIWTTAVPIGKGVIQRTACRNSRNSTGWLGIGEGQRVLLWARRWGGRGRSWARGGALG